MYKISDIILTKEERKTMQIINKHKSYSVDLVDSSILQRLNSFGLINHNYRPEIVYGKKQLDGTVSVTDNYERYKRYRFDLFITGKFTTFIAFAALFLSIKTEILSVIQWLVKLLK